MIEFLLKSSLVWGFSLLIYTTILRNGNLKLNRLFLLTAMVTVPIYFSLPTLKLTEVKIYSYKLGAIPIKEGAELISAYSRNSLSIWLIILVAGIIIGLIKLILTLQRLYLLRVNSSVVYHKNIKYYRIKDSNDAFTFWGNIYIGEKIEAKEIPCVLEHELAHKRLFHSLDLMTAEFLLIFLWFHPLIYIFKKQLIEVHEFQADKAVIKKYTLSHYGELLLQNAMNTRVSLLHRFSNHSSLLKKRIIMMKKNQKKQGVILHFLAFPLVFALTWLLNIEKVKSQTNEEPDKMPVYGQCSLGNKQETEICSMQNLMKDLSANFKYPENAKKEKVQGKVFAEFIVNKNGKAEDIKILKSLHPDCDKEAISVIGLLKNFTPGEKAGKAVSVKMVLPVSFQLE